MPEDPRILTPRETIHNLCNRRCSSDIYVSDRELLRLLTEADAAHRERIATLEERNDELRVCFQYANKELPLLRAENGRLEADNRRLREAIENAAHQDNCHVMVDKCYNCGEEYDAHPNNPDDGDLCEEFRPQRDCDCGVSDWKRVALQPAAPPQLSGEAGEKE